MTFLRKLLKFEAALWALGGTVTLIAPHRYLVSLFRQPPYADYAYVRSMGMAVIVIALFMVLVAQRLDDVWWWAWAFAIGNAGLASIAALQALFGPVDGVATVYWWMLAVTNGAFGAATLVALARAEQTKPFV